jgi:hypothetical protein
LASGSADSTVNCFEIIKVIKNIVWHSRWGIFCRNIRNPAAILRSIFQTVWVSCGFLNLYARL